MHIHICCSIYIYIYIYTYIYAYICTQIHNHWWCTVVVISEPFEISQKLKITMQMTVFLLFEKFSDHRNFSKVSHAPHPSWTSQLWIYTHMYTHTYLHVITDVYPYTYMYIYINWHVYMYYYTIFRIRWEIRFFKSQYFLYNSNIYLTFESFIISDVPSRPSPLVNLRSSLGDNKSHLQLVRGTCIYIHIDLYI